MIAWRIHLVWLALAVVGAAAWGKHVASRTEREVEARRTAAIRRPELQKGSKDTLAPEAVSTSPLAPNTIKPLPSEAPNSPTSNSSEARPTEVLTPEKIGTLLRSKNREEARRGVRAIEKLADRGATLALLREALIHPEEGVRERALDILRKLGGPEAAELLAHTLRTDQEDDVRERAARHLGDIGGPIALAALQEAAGGGPMDVQVAASGSLNKLGQPAAMQTLLQQIGRMLENPDGAVREDAVGYLDDLRTPSAIPQLSMALRDSNSDIRRDAIEALEDLALPEVIPLLEHALSDPHPSVVRDAKEALEKLRGPGR